VFVGIEIIYSFLPFMVVVVQQGGKQYMVEPGKTIDCEKINVEVGSTFNIDPANIVFAHDGQKIVDDKSSVVISCKVLDHDRSDKIIVFKKQRRTSRFTKTRGHRQSFTLLLVESVVWN
jgi:large subunit ribosomal protein L21